MNLRSLLVIAALGSIVVTVTVGLGTALTPLLISLGLAYLVFPLIHRIEKWGLKRHYTVGLVFLFITCLMALTFTIIVPGLLADGKSLLIELPQSTASLVDRVENIAAENGYELHFNKETVKAFIAEHTSEITGTMLKSLSTGFKGLFTNSLRWLLAVLNIFLIPLFFFYVVNDFEKISMGLRTLVPPSFRSTIRHYLSLTNQVLSGYIHGQLLVAGLLSLLYGIGLSLIGLRFGFLIGVVSGLLSIIPYAGFSIGFLTSIVVGFANFKDMSTIIGIVIIFIVVQVLEGTMITPRLVGNKVGLSPLHTILALIIGGNLFGLTGMLVAIPVTAVLKVILKDILHMYQNLEFYKERPRP
jgi:predicted PurR-regulated permease PerM